MHLDVFTHSDLTPELKDIFNRIWSTASSKDENIFEKGGHTPQDLYFYLYDDQADAYVAVGRYRYVTGIKIGNIPWVNELWGRASIATDPKYQGKGFGKQLVTRMSKYALERKMWVIGFHGKRDTLSDFYRKCDLEVDREIGMKLYYPKDGELAQHSKVGISYFEGDPFIDAVRLSNEKIYLPYSW